MSEARGCLLFALPRTLLGGAAALGRGRALPALDLRSMHPTDRVALQQAQQAAQAAHTALFGADHGVSDSVLADVGGQLVGLVDKLHELGRRLAEARAFLTRNDPDTLARERADVELKLIGASAPAMVQLRSEMASLEERGRLADRVAGELPGLEARLQAAGGELRAFRARVDASHLASDELVHELRAYQQSAEAALRAFEATREEMGA